MAHDTSGLAATVLGVLLCLYAVFSLTSPRLRVPPRRNGGSGRSLAPPPGF
jgi:hypothetical protein